MKIYFKLILVFYLIIFSSLKAQNWETNTITKKLSNDMIIKFGYFDKSLYAISENEIKNDSLLHDNKLIKINNDTIETYYLENISFGPLSKYRKKLKKNSIIENILISKEKYWIISSEFRNIDNTYKSFFMIRNDSINTICLNVRKNSNRKDLKTNNEIIINKAELDERGNLYLLISENIRLKQAVVIENEYLLKTTGKNFEKKDLPSQIINLKEYKDLFIYEKKFFYIIESNNPGIYVFDGNDSLLFKYSIGQQYKVSRKIKYYYQNEYQNINQDYRRLDKNIYFLISEAKDIDESSKAKFFLIKLDSDFAITRYDIPIKQSFNQDYTFLVYENNLYFSSYAGFKRYDLINNNLNYIKELSGLRERNFTLDSFFRNFYVRNNYLIGSYSYNDGEIIYCFPGLFFYKLK